MSAASRDTIDEPTSLGDQTKAFLARWCCCTCLNMDAGADGDIGVSKSSIEGSFRRPKAIPRPITATEEMNPVLLDIERRLEREEIDIDFPTAPALVARMLKGAAKELQYPHTFNGADTMTMLYRLLRMVLETLNDLVLSGLAGEPEDQAATLNELHAMCHDWIEERLDRFKLNELGNKRFPSDKINWKNIQLVNHPLARLYDGVSWLFDVKSTKYLARDKYGIPILATKKKLKVLLLQPPSESGCPVQFSNQALDTMAETHGNLAFFRHEVHNPDELLTVFARIRPDVVHFAGDVVEDCLRLSDGSTLFAEQLRNLMKIGSWKPMAVIFNAVTSQIGMIDDLADPDDSALAPECVIGTNVGLQTHFALKFSTFFYHSLSVGHTFLGAYRVASDAVTQFVGRSLRIRIKPALSQVAETREAFVPFYWEGGMKAKREEHKAFRTLTQLDKELFTFVDGFVDRTFEMVRMAAEIIALKDKQEALEDERQATRLRTGAHKARAHFSAAIVSQLELARDNPKYNHEHADELMEMARVYRREEMRRPEDWPKSTSGEDLSVRLTEDNVEQLIQDWTASLATEETDHAIQAELDDIEARHHTMDGQLKELFEHLGKIVQSNSDGDMLRAVAVSMGKEVAEFDMLFASLQTHRLVMAGEFSDKPHCLELLPTALMGKFVHYREWAMGAATGASVAKVQKEFKHIMATLRLEERLPVHRLLAATDAAATLSRTKSEAVMYKAIVVGADDDEVTAALEACEHQGPLIPARRRSSVAGVYVPGATAATSVTSGAGAGAGAGIGTGTESAAGFTTSSVAAAHAVSSPGHVIDLSISRRRSEA